MFNGPAPGERDPFKESLLREFEATIGWFVDTCVPESEPHSTTIRRWGRQILVRSPQASAVRLLECMAGVDVRPLLPRITAPVLLIHGDLDAIVPLESSRQTAAQIPRSLLRIIEGAGHVPTMTRAVEVAAAVNDFFNGAPG